MDASADASRSIRDGGDSVIYQNLFLKTVNTLEEVVENDSVYPVVRNKRRCLATLEFCKVALQYLYNVGNNVYASKESKKKKRSASTGRFLK